MGVFSKIGRSIKDFVKSDIGKAAIAVGSSFLIPGIGAAGAGTSLGMQAVTAGKSLFAAGKALIPEKGLMGLKGKIGETAMASLMGGGGGTSSYGGGSTGYSSLASEGLTTYSPEGSQTVGAPAAADYGAFMNESLQLYAYAETQGRKVT
tara:strand:- start:619 stop:1068 length:450 start_codon:yes stop_codon:yes gene_type:complete